MLRLAVFVGLVALCVASSPLDHCCSHEDRDIIQQQWKVLSRDAQSTKVKLAFGRLVLTKLAEVKPEVKELLKRVNIDHPESPEFGAYSMRIFSSLDLIINLLQDPEALDALLDTMADKGSSSAYTGLKPDHFQAFAEILNRGLRKVLDDYNSMSWKACFRGIFQKLSSKLHS